MTQLQTALEALIFRHGETDALRRVRALLVTLQGHHETSPSGAITLGHVIEIIDLELTNLKAEVSHD